MAAGPAREAAGRGPPGRGDAPAGPAQTTHVGYLILNGLTEWAGSAGLAELRGTVPRLGRACRLRDRRRDQRRPRPATPRSSTDAGCSSASATTSTGPGRNATPWSAHLARRRHTSRSSRGTPATGRSASNDDGSTMIAYKQRFEDDPVYGTDDAVDDDHALGAPGDRPTRGRAHRGVVHARGLLADRIAGAAWGRVATPSTGPTTGSSPGPASSTAISSAPTRQSSATSATAATSRWSTAARSPTGVGGTPRSFEIVATAPASPFDRESSLRPVARRRPLRARVQRVLRAR